MIYGRPALACSAPEGGHSLGCRPAILVFVFISRLFPFVFI
jgi:hypothetical protein